MTDKDCRVFMYRGREAQLFNCPEDVPEGEGWRDAPYDLELTKPPEASEPEKPKRGRPKKADKSDAVQSLSDDDNGH